MVVELFKKPEVLQRARAFWDTDFHADFQAGLDGDFWSDLEVIYKVDLHADFLGDLDGGFLSDLHADL